jgi:hypothetical protein
MANQPDRYYSDLRSALEFHSCISDRIAEHESGKRLFVYLDPDYELKVEQSALAKLAEQSEQLLCN